MRSWISSRRSMIGVCVLSVLISAGGCADFQRTPTVAGTSGQSGTSAADAHYLATVKIGNTPGRAIPPTFMGLSHEWGTAQLIMGDSTTGVNEIYRQLLRNLSAYGSDPMNMRIGGNSTDKTGEPTAETVQPFAELAENLGVHFYLGVNLGSDKVDLAVDQARSYLSHMPPDSVDAIEIGNEPDAYAYNGMRAKSYNFQDYLADFDTWKKEILPVLPAGTKLLGPSWASAGMLSNTTSFDDVEEQQLTAFSAHYYVANGKASNPPDILLNSSAATAGPKAVAAAVGINHAYGLPFRMGEMNSLYYGGADGISNTFQSALWAIDTMFEYANLGVDGVNWHTGNGGAYGLFYFNIGSAQGHASYSLSSVRPLYYGLLFFQAATGNHAQLVPVTLSTQANIKVWATIDATNTQRVVLINKDESASGTVQIAAAGYTHAKVVRLAAPSYQSQSGVSFGGQTFDGSSDGKIQGTPTVETVDPSSGSFTIQLPVTSAALVELTR